MIIGYLGMAPVVDTTSVASVSDVTTPPSPSEPIDNPKGRIIMPDPLSLIGTRATPQAQRAAPNQVRNAAGGFTFAVDDMARLRRFLVLGSEGGTYYTSEKELTRDNAEVVLRLAAERTLDVVAEVVAISQAGRAPKQKPGLFVLAACASLGDAEGRKAALNALPLVARTSTTRNIFVGYAQQFRGWGRGMRNALGRWYTELPADDLAYQMVKYRNREGWTDRDLLRKSHPGTDDPAHRALFQWALGKEVDNRAVLPDIIDQFEHAQRTTGVPEWERLARQGLPWECFPDAALKESRVWGAMLDHGMPIGALIRQLPRLTALGVLNDSRTRAAAVAERLTDPALLKKGRIHPVSVLLAARTYASGHGERGKLTWTPKRLITDALNDAFYAAYGAVEPTGKSMMLALDVSGSMGAQVAGSPITCREAAAAMALVTANVEKHWGIFGFTADGGSPLKDTRQRFGFYDSAISELDLSPRRRLDDAVAYTRGLNFGYTDCSLPMRYASTHHMEVDTFVIYTDGETWYGDVHPHQALREYREKSGIPARLVVVAMTATGTSLADPDDAGMCDIAGFDSTVPNVISDFARGL